VEGVPNQLPVVVLAYDGVAADEAGAIVEILGSAAITVLIASVEAAPVTSYHGNVVPTRTAADIGRCAGFVVPGGMGVRTASQDWRLIAAIAQLGAGATWLGATSTGSVLLAAAGLADHSRVTTHWLAGDMITSRGLELAHEPFVEHGRLLTAAGSASAATLAFRLVGALRGADAAAQARSGYLPVREVPRRRRRRWRRRRVELHHSIDPAGTADLVILDWDDVSRPR
jgi:transcriptional regulator GlxA family with amidase domain